MNPLSLQIVQIPAGQMDNFSYLVFCPASKKGIGIDPSLAPEKLLAAIKEHGIFLELLVNTHGHYDHTAGNDRILEATEAKLAAHPFDLPKAEVPLTEGTILTIGEATLEILHTPGHTPGSITLHAPGALITGDTLFVTRGGRADLANSDPKELYYSLKRLASFPPETKIYPGHNYGPQPVSTIAFEHENNPYLKCPDLDSFLRLRMG